MWNMAILNDITAIAILCNIKQGQIFKHQNEYINS